ncbi:MAG: hypothetical protein M3O50_07160 [Myxococcota bacterium]|nr:hypothetical protein [Myxococcota bacterium]
MVGIPQALDTDTEDVVWALQTAEALWRRAERADALVWLRRATQAAGESEDDDRALALAREAAELAEWMTRNPSSAGSLPVAPGPGGPRTTITDEVEEISAIEIAVEAGQTMPDLPVDPSGDDEEAAPGGASPSPPSIPVAFEAHAPYPAEDAPVVTREGPSPPRPSRVPSAAEKHAGMLDPWTYGAVPPAPRVSSRDAQPQESAAPDPALALLFGQDGDDVITSAPKVPLRPDEAAHPSWLTPPPSSRRLSSKPASARPTFGVDLLGVEAFMDLPDDARSAFGQAAALQDLAENEEVSGFALALVVAGAVDLAAAIVDTPVQQFSAGDVIRARGTIHRVTATRLVGRPGGATIATWDERAIASACRTCPWVDDDLLAAGDRLQAMVGITLGSLGERLDPDLRAAVLQRLTLRVLTDHEIFASRGKPLPGLLIVGAGEIELVDDAGKPAVTALRPGDFLFPHEALRAAKAPLTARAAKGGAVVLFAERGVAHELLVTCPPLLEVFAGM